MRAGFGAIAWTGMLLLASAGSAQEPKKDVKPARVPKLAVQCDRAEAIYQEDQAAGFLLASSLGGEVTYRFTEDGFAPIRDGKLRVVPGQTYRLEGKLERPGFLRVELEQAGVKAMAVAAIAPNRITPTSKPPADFEEFWKQQLQDLAKVKVDADLDYVATKSTKEINVFRVTLGFVDKRRVHAWLAVPKGTGPYPIVLTLPGAGVYAFDDPDYETAKLGALAMTVSIHNLAVDAPRDHFEKEGERALKNYPRRGWDDKYKTYFRYAILAGVRALDYLTSRKDFNGKEVLVTGVSQGGGPT